LFISVQEFAECFYSLGLNLYEQDVALDSFKQDTYYYVIN